MRTIRIFLLVAFLAVVGAGLLQFNFGVSPADVGRFLIAQIGSGIGVTVGVPPNSFNTLAQQLKEKESALLEKEMTLEQKEAAQKEKKDERAVLAYFFVGGGILLILILLNFYFDHRRRRVSQISS